MQLHHRVTILIHHTIWIFKYLYTCKTYDIPNNLSLRQCLVPISIFGIITVPPYCRTDLYLNSFCRKHSLCVCSFSIGQCMDSYEVWHAHYKVSPAPLTLTTLSPPASSFNILTMLQSSCNSSELWSEPTTTLNTTSVTFTFFLFSHLAGFLIVMSAAMCWFPDCPEQTELQLDKMCSDIGRQAHVSVCAHMFTCSKPVPLQVGLCVIQQQCWKYSNNHISVILWLSERISGYVFSADLRLLLHAAIRGRLFWGWVRDKLRHVFCTVVPVAHFQHSDLCLKVGWPA